jgi:hypothetical protein
MGQTEPVELVENLKRGNFRSNVGIWRMPLSKIGQEADIAFRLDLGTLDTSKEFLSTLPAKTEYARLSVTRLYEFLDEIANRSDMRDCVLICNFDLLLAGLRKEQDRNQVWQDLYNRFPNRQHALLIAMPETASHLLPREDMLEKWQKDGRLS